MKKKLLIVAMLLGSLISYAQVTYSFEAEEGYSEGSLEGQNEWLISENELGEGVQGITVTGIMALDGIWSLSLTRDASMEAFDDAAIGAGSPIFEADFPKVLGSISVFLEVDDDNDTPGSFYDIVYDSAGDGAIASLIRIMPDGSIHIKNEGGLAEFADTGFSLDMDQWNTISVAMDFAEGIARYKLDGMTIFQGVIWSGATSVDNVAFFHNNAAGSTLFIDNFSVVEEETAGVNEVLASKLSAFPNPTSNVVNITNAENILVNSVVVADLNGRTVKTAKFNGVYEAQINIADLASGVYMMTVSSDKGTTTKKIVKN